MTNKTQQSSGMSRRSFVASVGLATASAWLAPGRAVGGEAGPVDTIKKAAATGTVTITNLRGNISVLMGSGGNIAVLPGPDGKLLVDSGIAVSEKKITNALASISSDPVGHLINTHWHFDHTDGNNWVHSAGATIVAHKNTRKRMAVRHRVEGWRFTFPPAPRGALPTIVFDRKLTLHMNGTTIALEYYEPAHTDSDISVYFTHADVFHAGDTWWNGVYPFIDYSSGGNIDGTIEAVETNLSKVTDRTIIIPGHGPIGNKAQMSKFRDMLVAIREKVSSLKEQGKSLTQTIAAKPTADFDAKFGQFVITPDTFTELVYTGV
jgi:glyoxylase-like metal-dependent hydrolase (beta-lactamase superfamily II)